MPLTCHAGTCVCLSLMKRFIRLSKAVQNKPHIKIVSMNLHTQLIIFSLWQSDHWSEMTEVLTADNRENTARMASAVNCPCTQTKVECSHQLTLFICSEICTKEGGVKAVLGWDPGWRSVYDCNYSIQRELKVREPTLGKALYLTKCLPRATHKWYDQPQTSNMSCQTWQRLDLKT